MGVRAALGPEYVGGRVVVHMAGGDVLVDAFILVSPLGDELLGLRVAGPDEERAGRSGTSRDDQGALAEVLRSANPRPRRIRVVDADLARETRAMVGPNISVDVAPTPEIDAMAPQIREIVEAAARITPEQKAENTSAMRDLFVAAAALWRAAPWNVLDETMPLRLSIPTLGIDDACLVVLASDPQARHLAFFPAVEDCVTFLVLATANEGRDRDRRLQYNLVSLQFRDLPEHVRQSFAGWPLGAEGEYPVVTPVRRDGSTSLPSCGDLLVMTACCRALAAFTVAHRDALASRTTAALSVHLRSEQGSEVRLWLEALENEA